MKTCKRCNEELALDKFSKSKVTKDGYEGKCKICRRNQRPKIKMVCNGCHEEFEADRNSIKYCSRECASKGRRKQVTTSCGFCNKELGVPQSVYDAQENHFCDRSCFAESLKETMKAENNPNYTREDTECFNCGEVYKEQMYKIKTHKFHFCSSACYKEGLGKTREGELSPLYARVVCTCVICDKSFERIPSLSRGKTYCSKECRNKGLTKHRVELSAELRGTVSCLNCGKSVEKSISRIKNTKYHYCSIPCKDKHLGVTFNSGKNNYNYNGALTSKYRIQHRLMPEYSKWRTSVYIRDNYSCVICKDSRGGNLIAHHLYSYETHEELRLDINNGVTLCDKCHKGFHKSYGYRNNTKEQFNEYVQYANHEPSRTGNWRKVQRLDKLP